MKNILVSTLLLSLIFAVGCEDGDSSNKTLEEKGTVVGVNQPKFDGDIAEFTLENGDVVRIRSKTSIRRQRESCSGFNSASASDIINGDYIEYTYLNPDGVDYANRTYTAKHIDAYRAECLEKEEHDAEPEEPEEPEVQ